MIIHKNQYSSSGEKSRFFEKSILVKNIMSVCPSGQFPELDQIFLIEKNKMKNFSKVIDFIPLQKSHFPLLYQWLNLQNQLEWYGDGQKVSHAKIKEKYSPYCHGFKEENSQRKPLYAFMITWNDCFIGYIQFYNACDFKRDSEEMFPYLRSFQGKCAALDFYIADPAYLGRGIAPMILKQFLKRYVWRKFSACFVDPDLRNDRAIKAYEKAGFEKVIAIPSEICVPMLTRK